MWESAKRNWRQLKASRPGCRFQDRYHRSQETNRDEHHARKLIKMGSGLLIAAGGVFLMPAPGPGLLVFFFGASLLAGEFLFVARFLDWLELRIRQSIDWAHRVWEHTPLTGRIVLGLLLLALLAAAGYGTYFFVWGR